jgi:hypothetical protein
MDTQVTQRRQRASKVFLLIHGRTFHYFVPVFRDWWLDFGFWCGDQYLFAT